MKKYKVEGKEFDYLKDARAAAKRIKAGLPNDTPIVIYKAMDGDEYDTFGWEPYETK